MVAGRIKYAMAHLSHKQHIALLAQPNWRKTQRVDMNISLDPYAIPRAALRSRASRRIKMMAEPKHVNRKYDPSLLLDTMRSAPINRNIRDNLRDHLYRVQGSRYQRYRVICNAIQQRDARRKRKLLAKLRKALTTPDDWKRHMEVLKKLAAPKVQPRPKPLGRKKKWRPVNMRRVENLAQPVAKEPPDVKDPYAVPESALTYKITDRMLQITVRKNPQPIIEPRVPGAVTEAAMKAVASPRTIILAKPAVRPAGMETDLREDAFTVSPAALKARCSKRLKILARPKSQTK